MTYDDEVRPRVGDKVYLKSGSQRMCVEFIRENDFVGVVWMKYEDHEIRRDELPLAVLDLERRGEE